VQLRSRVESSLYQLIHLVTAGGLPRGLPQESAWAAEGDADHMPVKVGCLKLSRWPGSREPPGAVKGRALRLSQHCRDRYIRQCPAPQPAHDVGPYVLGGKTHRCVTDVGSQLPEVAGEVVVLETLREPLELSKWLDAGRIASRSVLKRLTGGPQPNLVLVEGRSPIEVPASATLHKAKLLLPVSGSVVSTPRLGRSRK
jgi:hypothetical protein